MNIEIKLTKEEHKLVTAILMMPHIGMVMPIHEDNRPLLSKVAQDFSLRDIRKSIEF